MKKLLSLILSVSLIAAAAWNVCAADDPSASTATSPEATPAPTATATPTTTSAPTAKPTALPTSAPETEPTEAPDATEAPEAGATGTPDADATATPVPTAEPTESPTPEPTPEAKEFFYCMHDGSQFAYIMEDEKPKLVPMIASNNVAVAPKIEDGITYLPFRYVFEEMLGFTDVTKYDITMQDDKQTQTNGKEYGAELEEKEYQWHNRDDDGKLEIRYMLNGEEKTLVQDEWNTDIIEQVFKELMVVDDVSYVPLRFFSRENVCFLDWDDDSRSIFMAGTKEYGDKCFEEVKKVLTCNNNFITYSDAVYSDGSVISLADKTQSAVYSASSNCGLAFYSDENMDVCCYDLENNTSISPLEVRGGDGNVIDNLKVDRLTVCGDMIYGIKIGEENNYTGNLFSARLKVDVNEDQSSDSKYTLHAGDYRELTSDNEAVMFSIGNNNFIYYVDAKDNYTMKRIDINRTDERTVVVTEDGNPLSNVDYYDIGNESIAYNDFRNGQIKTAAFDGQTVGEPTVAENVKSVRFIRYDDVNDCYYYITTLEGESNKLKRVKLSSEQPETLYEAEDIYNMSVFGGSVYAMVDGKFTKCN